MSNIYIQKLSHIATFRLNVLKVKRKVKRAEKKLASHEKLLQGLDMIGFEQLELETKALKQKKVDRIKELKQLVDQSRTIRLEMLPRIEHQLQTSKTKSVALESVVQISNETMSGLERKHAPLKIKINQDRAFLQSKAALKEKQVVETHYDEALAEESTLRRRLDELKMTHFQLSAKLHTN